MYVFGRILGVTVGWYIFHIPGAILGFIVGYYFDRGLSQFQKQMDPEVRRKVELTLFQTVFPLLGVIAKADGRVSEAEIQSAEQMMSRMQLSDDVRQEAIRLFQQGIKPDFALAEALREFMAVCQYYPDIKQLLLVYLITLAMADGQLHQAEIDVLRQVSQGLGYADDAFEHILRMAEAQGFFHQRREDGVDSPGATQMAYQALGVDENIGDNELKRAYRKLMSQYHPDKLSGQGAPDEMIKVATERSQEIQAAYELLKKQREKKH